MSHIVRKPDFAYAKDAGMQVSFAVIVKLISTFVFATRIVQYLFFFKGQGEVKRRYEHYA